MQDGLIIQHFWFSLWKGTSHCCLQWIPIYKPSNSVLMFFCFSRPLPVFCLYFLFDVLYWVEAVMVPHGDLICTCWWCRMLSTFVHTCWWFTGLALRNINSGFLMFGYRVFELHIHFGYKLLPRQMLYYSVLNKWVTHHNLACGFIKNG